MRLVVTALLLVAVTLLLAPNRGGAEQAGSYDPRAAFAETDTNKDGAIDLEEFHVRLVEIFYNADGNKDGFLTVDEYDRLPYSGDFKDADVDGDGRLSLHEFVRIRYRQFEAADHNDDAELSIDEVVEAYKGSPR